VSMAVLRVEDLGTTAYRDAYARQLALVDERKTGGGEDTLLLVEHPHVITVGRSRAALANVVAAGDVEVVEIERGGDVTYHGPGQLVAYPIVLLREGAERDLHKFLRNLEEAVIRTLARFDLDAGREPGKTGVWLDNQLGARKKICSIGIACRRWVTFHGLALNVSTDLGYFFRINPCGFDSSVMTSVAEELALRQAQGERSIAPDLAEVKRALAAELAIALGRSLA
jgi:lipoyl(octanoyl) transferase